MHISQLEKIFGVDKVVPVDTYIASFFSRYYYMAIYPGRFLQKSHISFSIPTIEYYCT